MPPRPRRNCVICSIKYYPGMRRGASDNFSETMTGLVFPYPLRLPICAAPMFLVSSPALVIAACTSGVMGAFPTPNARSTHELRAWMSEITEALARARTEEPDRLIGPWVVNLVTHRTNSRLAEDLALVAEFKPPVVITALGSPKPAIEIVHSYGGLVIADVTTLELAHKAADAGADGLACVCAGSGGHTGMLSPLAFISAVRRFYNGYIFAGGGIADGAGLLGAISAGADIAYMGTRFIAAQESMADEAHKRHVIEANISDLIVSAAITGAPASWLKRSLVESGYDLEQLTQPGVRSYDSNSTGKKRWKEIFAAGQGVGDCSAVEPTAEIIDRLEREYMAAAARASRFFAKTA